MNECLSQPSEDVYVQQLFVEQPAPTLHFYVFHYSFQRIFHWAIQSYIERFPPFEVSDQDSVLERLKVILSSLKPKTNYLNWCSNYTATGKGHKGKRQLQCYIYFQHVGLLT